MWLLQIRPVGNRSGTSVSLSLISKFLNESQLGVGDGRALWIIIYRKPWQCLTRVKQMPRKKNSAVSNSRVEHLVAKWYHRVRGRAVYFPTWAARQNSSRSPNSKQSKTNEPWPTKNKPRSKPHFLSCNAPLCKWIRGPAIGRNGSRNPTLRNLAAPTGSSSLSSFALR